jgi:hypothetical protein
MKTILHLLLFFTFPCVGLAADVPRQKQEDDIREAVFRYQFDNNASGQKTNAKVYCLAVGEKQVDPSGKLLRRFANHTPPVRKISECGRSAEIRDKRTGERGLLFYITQISWVSSTEVKVTGGYYEGSLSASGETYVVKKDGSTWKIISAGLNWISQAVNDSFEKELFRNEYSRHETV